MEDDDALHSRPPTCLSPRYPAGPSADTGLHFVPAMDSSTARFDSTFSSRSLPGSVERSCSGNRNCIQPISHLTGIGSTSYKKPTRDTQGGFDDTTWRRMSVIPLVSCSFVTLACLDADWHSLAAWAPNLTPDEFWNERSYLAGILIGAVAYGARSPRLYRTP